MQSPGILNLRKDMTESDKKQRTHQIALLVALSCVLQISESLIPHPIPGLRLGLANMLTLVALIVLDFRTALEIAVFRTLLSSLIIGTFMSPTFILSFSGAVISTFAMGFFYWLSCFHPRYRLSIFGISIVGALTHNMVQLYLAYLILVRHGGIFVFLPWLCFGAVFTGWVTGAVAGRVCRSIGELGVEKIIIERRSFSGPAFSHHIPGNSFLHRMQAETKIAALFFLALNILIFSHFLFYAGLFFSLAAIIACSEISPRSLFSRVRKYRFLVVPGFFLPLFFNSDTQVLFSIFHFDITLEGLTAAGVFAFRILFLIILSALMTMTTSPGEITRGVEKLLSPLGHVGISEKRIAGILSLSWTAIPHIWETARESIRAAELGKVRNLHKMIPLLSNLIAVLYLESEPESRHSVSKDPVPNSPKG